MTDVTLGGTIRAWRDRMEPSAAGLPGRRSRRTPGLRREELADLAGVSVDYLVRLEQGRATAPSVQVVAALARALQLDRAERDHLYRLANLVPPAPDAVSDHIPPGVQRLLTRLANAAVAVFAADWQLIWWNECWRALIEDPALRAPACRNFARDSFPTGPEPHATRWPLTVEDRAMTDAAIVSDLRRATARFPSDRRLTGLIADLQANPEFARLWAQGTVAAHREDHKTIHHPSIGPIELDCDVLTDGDLDLKIVFLTPSSAEDDTKLRLARVADGEQLTVTP